MPIYQTNLWVCEICDSIETTVQEVFPYSDPLVSPPDGLEWNYMTIEGKELFACPKCLNNHR